MTKQTLHEKTKNLLVKTTIPVPEIAAACNVKERWLYSVIEGLYEDPGVNKIERVYEFLSKE